MTGAIVEKLGEWGRNLYLVKNQLTAPPVSDYMDYMDESCNAEKRSLNLWISDDDLNFNLLD